MQEEWKWIEAQKKTMGVNPLLTNSAANSVCRLTVFKSAFI